MSNRNFGWQAIAPTVQGIEPPAPETPLTAEGVGKEARSLRSEVIGAMRKARSAHGDDRRAAAAALDEKIQAAGDWLGKISLRIEQQIPEHEQFPFVEKLASLEAAIADAVVERQSRVV